MHQHPCHRTPRRPCGGRRADADLQLSGERLQVGGGERPQSAGDAALDAERELSVLVLVPDLLADKRRAVAIGQRGVLTDQRANTSCQNRARDGAPDKKKTARRFYHAPSGGFDSVNLTTAIQARNLNPQWFTSLYGR